MLDLNKSVFGHITLKEIIGAQPPATPDTQDMLAFELNLLLKELQNNNGKDISQLLEEQKKANELVNSRPGAMALAQNKIRLFNEYNNRYMDAISDFMCTCQDDAPNDNLS